MPLVPANSLARVATLSPVVVLRETRLEYKRPRSLIPHYLCLVGSCFRLCRCTFHRCHDSHSDRLFLATQSPPGWLKLELTLEAPSYNVNVIVCPGFLSA